MALGGSLPRADHRRLIRSGRRFRRFGQLVHQEHLRQPTRVLFRPAPPRSCLTQRLT